MMKHFPANIQTAQTQQEQAPRSPLGHRFKPAWGSGTHRGAEISELEVAAGTAVAAEASVPGMLIQHWTPIPPPPTRLGARNAPGYSIPTLPSQNVC